MKKGEPFVGKKKKNKAEDVEDQIEGTEIADEERDGSRVKKDGNMNWSCLKGKSTEDGGKRLNKQLQLKEKELR